MKKNEIFRCIAIDMGASNIRIMLGSISHSGLDYTEVYRFANNIIERGGHERWDIENIVEGIIKGVKKAISAAGESIASLGVDSWGVDFALLDSEGNLMEYPVAYRDRRTEGMEEKWLEMMSREETFRRTGINFYIFNTLFQLLALKDQAELISVSKILFLPSYIQARLSGQGRNELTISSTSQLLQSGEETWDPEILKLLGIPHRKLGEVCAPGTILGELTHPDLNETGIKAISVCSHDTASAVVSVPFTDDSSVFISTGTWCLLGMELSTPILSQEAMDGGFTNERGFGGSFRCLKNIVGLWLVQGLIKSLQVKEDYAEIESMASQYDQIHIINPGDPIFYNPENMKDAFDEYFQKTDQDLPAETGGYFRAAYDSLIFSFRYHIELIERMTGKEISTIHLIGGGCQSPYLTRETANICNRSVVSGPVEAATIGNILVQGIGMGVVENLQQARQLVRKSMSVDSFSPESDTDSLDSSYSRFLEFAAKSS